MDFIEKRARCTLQFVSIVYICTHNNAGVVKLVDTPDLGSGAARFESSSLSARTKSFSETRGFFYFHQ